MSRWTAGLWILFLLALALLGCGEPPRHLPGHPGARTILPPEKVDQVEVLPNGRWVAFQPTGGGPLSLLDVATGEEIVVSDEIHRVMYLGDGLLHGTPVISQFTGLDNRVGHYVVNLQPVSVVKLEPLPGGWEALPQRARETDDVYVWGSLDGYLVLLLDRGPDGAVARGYYVDKVSGVEALLAGIPYKTPPIPPYNREKEKLPSPDGRYYYTCPEGPRIYSQEGEQLRMVSRYVEDSRLMCYGWAWDSSGVYFQETRIGSLGPTGSYRIGPLELLEVGQ